MFLSFFKFITAILLLPLCLGFSIALGKAFLRLDYSSPSFSFLAIGFIFYLLFHLIFYKPLFLQVIGHELVHLLWNKIFLGRYRSLNIERRASSIKGSVVINRSNFLVALAPYFFPLYTLFALGLYLVVDRKYSLYVVFFIGTTLAFHLLLNFYSLKEEQKDIKEVGTFFSYTFIYLMNVFVLGLILTVLFPQSIRLKAFLSDSLKYMGEFYELALKIAVRKVYI